MRRLLTFYQLLNRNFRIYFFVGILWSLGLMIFFLVYNLYLIDLGFNEAVIGQIVAAMSAGTLCITFPSGWLLDRFGVTRSIQAAMLSTVILLGLRALVLSPWFLTLLAFMNGIAIGCWIVALPPFLAHNTTAENRSWVFSLTYGSSIATGIIAGIYTSAISRMLTGLEGKSPFSPVQIKQFLLFSSMAFVIAGFGLSLLLHPPVGESRLDSKKISTHLEIPKIFALPASFYKILPVLLLWGLFVGSFPPFFSIFFWRQFGLGLDKIGILSSLSQAFQVSAVMCMPVLIGRIGQVKAIGSMQAASALTLPLLIWATQLPWAIIIYLAYLSAQVMCEPALENFIMSLVPPSERNRMASLRYTAHFLMSAFSVAISGYAIAHLGYNLMLGCLSLVGITAALIFFQFYQGQSQRCEKEAIRVQT